MARSFSHLTPARFVSLFTDGLRGDRPRLENAALALIREWRSHAAEPAWADKLAAVLAQHRAGLSNSAGAPPIDPDTAAHLLRVEEPASAVALAPILPPAARAQAARFLRERRAASSLLAEGFEPPRTLLLHGAPGTGKTALARHLAAVLGLPLATLDLATAITSLLGKTGLNLRRVLDYGRRAPCVLFLDEFDAVAKRRDDASDVGELKRAVNVLLKEMETWPASSVLVAATNHPGLLDPAVFRRFDQVIELPLPGQAEREALLLRSWPGDAPLARAAAAWLDGETPATVAAYAARVGRARVVEGGSLRAAALREAFPFFPGTPARRRAALGRAARPLLGAGVTAAELRLLSGEGTPGAGGPDDYGGASP